MHCDREKAAIRQDQLPERNPADYVLGVLQILMTSDVCSGHKCHQALTARICFCAPPHHATSISLNRHIYDNVALKEDRHIYKNDGELRDATPDLILAVKPKFALEDEQVTEWRPKDALQISAPYCPPRLLSLALSLFYFILFFLASTVHCGLR